MRFETNRYEASHGKAPKGFGLWMMTLTTWTGLRNEDFPFEFTGTLTEAKRAARAYSVKTFGKHMMVRATILP